MAIDPARTTRSWVRPVGMLAVLVADGLLALALLAVTGIEVIAAYGFRDGPITRGVFTEWLLTFACWAALMAVPVVIGVRRGWAELVVIQVVVVVVLLAAWSPKLLAGWHDIHAPAVSTPDPVVPTRACTGHIGNPCPGG
jgi:hypothetical protein